MTKPEMPARPREDGSDEAGALATVGDVVAAVLVAAGVHEVFGVVGGKLGPLLAAIGRRPELRWVGTRHEAAGAWMATAVTHGTGRLAVCVGELGPGAHNLVGGLLTASANHLPVLVVTSSNPRRFTRPEHGMSMAGNTHELLDAVTKWSTVVPDAASAVGATRDAIRRAVTGRPGPVHVEVPADVLVMGAAPYMQAASVRRTSWLPSGRAHADPVEVGRAAEVVRNAERILVIGGGGVTASDASGELRALIAATGAAATVTQMGIGCVSTGDPSFVGHGGVVFGEAPMRAAREADLVVAVGCRWSSWTWDGSTPAVIGPPHQDLVQIDIDPAAIGTPVPVSVGLVGDARAVLAQLNCSLGALGGSATRDRSPWATGLVDQHLAYQRELGDLATTAEDPMHPARLAKEIASWLPQDALVVYDGGHTSFWSNDLTPALEPRTRFHDPGAAHLGFGAPYANALKLVMPQRCVLNVTGDGAFGFTLNELDTARREGLGVIHVIHDNASWGVIRYGQHRGGFDLGTDLAGTDYAAIARGFGCFGATVDDPALVAPTLDAAASSGLPAVIDVRVRFEPHPALGRFARLGREP